MRKYLAFVMVCICLVGLVGCNSSKTAETLKITDEKIDENSSAETILREITLENAIGETATLSEEDANIILEILENGEWCEYPTECASDCRLMIGENYLTYHSECGSFSGAFKGETISHLGSLTIDDETQQLVNSVFEKYVALGKY